MFKIYKIGLLSFLLIGLNQNANAFDLKSLTDKIQKDVGGKLNIPSTSSGSNPLGGMLKGLNQNNTPNFTTSPANVNAGANKQKLAENMCVSTYPKTISNLPKGDLSLLEKDFGKNQNDIKKIINTTPPTSNDPFVSSLNTFEGAFETKEIESLFNNFISKKNINDLANIRAISQMNAGFSADKKQIKADALFAYGIIHYYLREVGGKRDLGIEYIKQAVKGPDNIGALTVYGAWQFNGLNVKENIQAGNMSALTGYQRANEKKLKLNQDGPFKGLKPFKWSETVFYEIAANNKNPYKQQYQDQISRAKEMNKQVMAELAKSEKNDPKSGYWPFMIEQQNLQHEIISDLADNMGLGDQLSELKSQYVVLAGKVSNDNQLVEKMVDINKTMADKILKSLENTKSLDDQGKVQIANLAHDNEIILLRTQNVQLQLISSLLSSGGFGGAGFHETTRIIKIVGENEKIACDVYNGVTSYASRTKVPLLKAVTSENATFKSKFKRKKRS